MAVPQPLGDQAPSRNIQDSEVIYLSTSSPGLIPAVAGDKGEASVRDGASATTTSSRFRSLRLRDFDVGERLGAKRDGGNGFQGCNSRVFRVTLHRPRQMRRKNSRPPGGEECFRYAQGVPTTSPSHLDSHDHSDMARNNRSGGARFHTGTSRASPIAGRSVARRRPPASPTGSATASAAAAVARRLVGVGERLFRGSFGACFSGHDQTWEDESPLQPQATQFSEVLDGATSGLREANRPKETEFALKMALTLRGQDPAQAQREMATEIAVLVGGRLPPHTNIMRGLHCFQDEVGQDLRPVLWAGLGPQAGEDLSPCTCFLVMPLFTAGSLQALLNKRLGRCNGPPYLRVLDMVRFLEQMLSAVGHLLEHGLAHNDIKPDNWLLTNDQRSLVLTDFGSCVDSLRPQPIPSPTIPSSPPVDGAVDSAACAKSESEAHVITSDIVTAPSTSPLTSPLPLHLPSASCSGSNDAGTSTESGTESGTRLVSAERGVGTTNASLGEEAASGPGGKSLDVVGGALPTSATEGGDGSDASSVATSAATATTEERRRKRPCVAKESHEGSGPSGGKNEREAWSSSRRSRRDMSEGLVFPFCEYFSAGTPSFLAPELDRAWRERGVMDFRRSDVYSVGVCMYHMLRPGGPPAPDNQLHPEFAEEERFRGVGREWPLPIFPEHRGGCPFEVAQLCRGLLEREPSRRASASEGLSLAKWIVSRLEDAVEPCEGTRPARAPPADIIPPLKSQDQHRDQDEHHHQDQDESKNRQDHYSRGEGQDQPQPKRHQHHCEEGPNQDQEKKEEHLHPVTGNARFPRPRPVGAKRGDDESAGSTDDVAVMRSSADPGVLGKRSREMDDHVGVCESRESRRDGLDRSRCLPPAALKGVVEERRARTSTGAGAGAGLTRATGKAALRRNPVVYGDQHLSKDRERDRDREPDDLVRADRVSQLRFCFARATPEELFENLQARGWDVQRACDAFGHNDDYDGSAEGLRRDNSRYPCPMEVDSFSDELPAPRRLSPASLWRASHGGVSVGRMRPPEELAWFGVRGGEARELRDRFRTVAAVPPALWRHRPVDVFSVSHFGRSLGP